MLPLVQVQSQVRSSAWAEKQPFPIAAVFLTRRSRPRGKPTQRRGELCAAAGPHSRTRGRRDGRCGAWSLRHGVQGHLRAEARSVLGSWVKPYGTRLEIRKGEKGAVRLPKILVLASRLLHARRTAIISMTLLTTERLLQHGRDHTAEQESAPWRPIPYSRTQRCSVAWHVAPHG